MKTESKHFKFKMYIKTARQEFLVHVKGIDAPNYDDAVKQLHRKELPFHHFATVEIIK